jgi:flagellar hook-length control protein FliK
MTVEPALEKSAPDKAEARAAPVQAGSAEPRQNGPDPKPLQAAVQAEPYRPEPPPLRERAVRELRVVRSPQAASGGDLPTDQSTPNVVAAAPSPGDARPSVAAHPADVTRSVDLALLDQIGSGALRASQLSRVTIQLHPPDLGTVAVAVESRNGQIYAHFHSTHPFVQAWIETNAPALRSHMTSAGVALHDITVSTSTQEQGSHERRQPLAQAENAQRERAGQPAAHPAAAQPSAGDSAVDWLA